MTTTRGRIHLGKSAALAGVSTLAALALAAGITQGIVGAAISSSSGFELTAPTVDASRLALTAGSAGVVGSVGSGNTTRTGSAIARLTGNTLAHGMCVGSNQNFPLLGSLGLSITTTGRVEAESLDLSSASLDLADADLPATSIGGPVADSDLKGAAGTSAGAFTLQSSSASGQQVKLTNVVAHAYGATLGSGLKVTSMKVGPRLFSSADAKVCD